MTTTNIKDIILYLRIIKKTINTKKECVIDCFSELNIKHGFDVGLEMSGHPQAFNEMLSTIYHGGKIVLLGLLPKSTCIDWNNIIFKGLQVRGVYGREMYETWYKMDQLIKSGLDLSKVITHKFSISSFDGVKTLFFFTQKTLLTAPSVKNPLSLINSSS